MKEDNQYPMIVPLLIMLSFILLALAIFSLSSCTYSITQVHTEGQATDIVDEQATPSVSFKMPMKAM